jgi:cell division protein FtsW
MRLRMDWILFGTILAMVSFGLVMVYSASSVALELKHNAKAAAAAAKPDSAEAPTPVEGQPAGEGKAPPSAPLRLPFGFSLRQLFALALGVVALRFCWRNYRLGVFTRPWALLWAGLVFLLQWLAYWMDAEKSPHWGLLVRQAGAALAGFFLMMYLSQRDYREFRTSRWAFSALGLVIFLLIVVYFADAKHRWLRVGVSIQPSELAKPALVLFLAWFVTLRRTAINHPATIWPAALALVALAGAVMIPDVGTAVVLVVTAAVIFYVAGLNWRYATAALGIGAILFLAAIVYEPYRLKRVIQFLDPQYKYMVYADPHRWLWNRAQQSTRVSNTRHQAEQSEIAVGTGGIFGRGAGESRQKLMFLPEAHNDYIFAIVAEELGLFGSTFLLSGFMIILWRGYRLFWAASDEFGRYLAVGISTMLVFQALLNMSVVLDLFPTKGIPLPLISFGGTSMLSSMLLLGMLLSVSQRSSA